MRARSVGLTAASLARLISLNPTSFPLTIGEPVNGGTVFGVLWEDAAGNLASGPMKTSTAGVTSIPAGGSLSIGGAPIGTNALAVMGTTLLTGNVNLGSSNISGTSAGGWSGTTWGLNWAAGRSFTMSSIGTIGFGGSDSGQVVNDSAFSRVSAGVMGVGTGAQGSVAGGLQLASLATGTFVADTGYNYQVPSTGFTITMANGNYHLILDPAGTLATGTITMCAAPVDGQCVDIKISQIITALTVAGNSGQSVKGNPTSAAVGSSFTGIYRATNTTWYF